MKTIIDDDFELLLQMSTNEYLNRTLRTDLSVLHKESLKIVCALMRLKDDGLKMIQIAMLLISDGAAFSVPWVPRLYRGRWLTQSKD